MSLHKQTRAQFGASLFNSINDMYTVLYILDHASYMILSFSISFDIFFCIAFLFIRAASPIQ